MDDFFEGAFTAFVAIVVLLGVIALVVITQGWILLLVAAVCIGGFINMFVNKEHL